MTSRKKSRTSPRKAAACSANNAKFPALPAPRAWFAAAVLAISLAAVYVPALDAPLIFDDIDTIARNESITRLWPLVGTSSQRGPLSPQPNIPTAARPLVNLTFAINYYFGGLNPVGYHAVNLVIHFLSAMFLCALTRRTLSLPYFAGRFESSAGWLALAAALTWALHPLQTETVIYATQRTELMMALFYLATLYCSLRYWSELPLLPGEACRELGRMGPGESSMSTSSNRHHRTLWLTLAILACLAGMASKEVMVSAPLIVLLYERTFIAGSLAKALRSSWPLYAGLAATWTLLLALTAGNPHSGAAGFALGPPAYVWWLTQSKIFWMYLKLAIWPWPLLIHYELPYISTFAEAWPYVIPLLLVGIASLVLLWRNHPLGFVGTWVFAILSPTFVIPIITEMAAERRMYLPLAALVVLSVVGVYILATSISRRRWTSPQSATGFRPAVIAVPTLVIAIVCGLASSKRLAAYEKPLELWQQVVHDQPQNDTAHQQLGSYLDKAGDLPAAIRHFREAVRLNPDLAQARFNLGVVLFKTRAFDEAASQFAAGARISPNDVRMPINMSGALVEAGRNDEARSALLVALNLAPNDWTVHNNLGEVLQRLGRYQESIASFQEALRLNPTALVIYTELANLYFREKQPEKAIAILQQGLDQARAAGDRSTAEDFAARLKEKR